MEGYLAECVRGLAPLQVDAQTPHGQKKDNTTSPCEPQEPRKLQDGQMWRQGARRSLFQTDGAGMPPPGLLGGDLPLDLPPTSHNEDTDTDSDGWIGDDLRYVLLILPSFFVIAGLILVVVQSVCIWHGRQRAAQMLRLENARSSILMNATDKQTSAKKELTQHFKKSLEIYMHGCDVLSTDVPLHASHTKALLRLGSFKSIDEHRPGPADRPDLQQLEKKRSIHSESSALYLGSLRSNLSKPGGWTSNPAFGNDSPDPEFTRTSSVARSLGRHSRTKDGVEIMEQPEAQTERSPDSEFCNAADGEAEPVPIAGSEMDLNSGGQGSKPPQSLNTEVQEVELTPTIQTEPSHQQLGAESQEQDSQITPKRVSEFPARTSLAVQSKPGRVSQVLGEPPPLQPASKKASQLFADGKPPPPTRASQKFTEDKPPPPARMSQQQAEGIPPPGRVSQRISGLMPGKADLRSMLPPMASDNEAPSLKTTKASFFQDTTSLAGTAPQKSVKEPSNGSVQSEVKMTSQLDPMEDDNNTWRVRKANMRQKYQAGLGT